MTCTACTPLLDEFVGGELDAVRAAAVGAHLAGCADCSAEVAAIRRENEIFARYERDVDVTPALWEGVWARIEQEATPAPRPGDRFAGLRAKLEGLAAAVGLDGMPRLIPALSAVAVAVIAVGATLAVFRSASDTMPATPGVEIAGGGTGTGVEPPVPPAPPEASAPESPAPSPAEAPKPPATRVRDRARTLRSAPRTPAPAEAADVEPLLPGQLARKTEERYLAVIAVLARDIEQRLPEMQPETRQQVDTTIAQLDRAIEGTRRAVAKDPSDPVAVQYMLAAYAKKVEVLQEVASR